MTVEGFQKIGISKASC